MAEAALGLRVVRGPDWEWGDQDGGEGFVGTVAGLEEGGGEAIVQWDMGQRCRYRCGRDNKFDLRILDPGPIPRSEVSGIDCDWCHEEGLVGYVWRCVRCLDYYLCSHCYNNDRHSTTHPFFRVDSNTKKSRGRAVRVRLSSRRDSRKTVVRGVFPGSHVLRGFNWIWRDQDGGAGTKGKVTAIKDWQQESLRSVAEVQWGERSNTNVYRLGHKGKVDLKCVEPAEGGSCYLGHLPVIGLGFAEGDCGPQSAGLQLSAGDMVKVDLDTEVLKLMQADHGGWNDGMTMMRGCVGVVNYIHSDGDPEVRYNIGQIYKYNIDAILKVEGEEVYFIGDVVKVTDDMSLLHDLQSEGPGWVDNLTLTLGQIGVVTKLTVLAHVQVRVNGKRWVYDPRCIVKVSPDLPPENHDDEDVDMNARSQMLTMIHSMSKEDLVVLAAAAGDANIVRQCLRQYPDQVNRMVDGRTAVHEACKEGYSAVLEVLLEYNADLEIMDDNGIRPVQSCAYSNCGRVMSLILEHGADVNSKGGNETTALMVAATLGHNTVLSIMLAHPLLNIQAGGPIGNTTLQCATAARRGKTIRLLLEAGADPSIADYTASTPLHQAVGMGHYRIVELMLMYYPNLINLQKEDDGYSLIHVAAANAQFDILNLLLQQSACQANIKTLGGLTALHIAAHEGHTSLIELLVGYGADLNATVEQGNTALHLIMVKMNMEPLSKDTPYTMEVEKRVKAVFGDRHYPPYTTVVCMLLLEGADLYQKNLTGDSPLAICPPDITHLVRNVVEMCGRGKYHGSLRRSSVPLPKLSKKTATSATGSGSDPGKAFPYKTLAKSSKPPENGSDRPSDLPSLPDDSDYENKQPPYEKQRVLKTLDKDSASKEASREDMLCCLCDQEINVRLSPCGHSVMCSDCSHMAKRCPTCYVPITDRKLLVTGI